MSDTEYGAALKLGKKQYQTDAVESVINVFRGQPNQANLEYIVSLPANIFLYFRL